MKPFLSILLLLSGSAFAQIAAVTKNPNNHQITGNLVMGETGAPVQPQQHALANRLMRTSDSYRDGGKVEVNDSGITFGTVDGMLTVQGSENHAIVARTPNPSDGIAVVGWSSSGAAAVKAKQDTFFNSPALTVWRDLSLGTSYFETTPGVLVAAAGGSATTEKAVEVQANGQSNFKITWEGIATSRDKPLVRFHGRLSTAPTGTYGTDISAGDLFFNTSDSKFYCHDGISWKPM